MSEKLIQRDLDHIWHPASYMQDFKQNPPLIIESAKGSYIKTDKGILIDAISSWWCKSLGHAHPKITSAIKSQLDKFEHVIMSNTTNRQIVELAEKLTEISGKQHIFFASDGSSAVEIAMKLAMQATQLNGNKHKQKFISLKNAYHGETFATMKVSDLGVYKQSYTDYGPECYFLDPIPYISGTDDPLWNSCDSSWSKILPKLEKLKDETCAILVEPIVQGAAGMQCYSADFLAKLADFSKKNNIYLIADEIMTGIGRTGKWLACDHANIQADMICLSKGLTSGSLPLSVVLIDSDIYELFNKDYSVEGSFLHSHTFSGNPLAVSAALATINVMQEENTNQQAHLLGNYMREKFSDIAGQTRKITNIRSIGALVAGDLTAKKDMRAGYLLAQEARKRGALLRPIGNTIYWLPPLNTSNKTIDDLAEITFNSIDAIFKKNPSLIDI
ncbi:MAG: adenosylmethionine--8-amino-7-oxononanoate transaminase [Legionellaceae bacterium]|nr:adenosylmethionine--8-amino-7-oxononanoate transaminase [Legionellaceae bacterium]